MRKRGETQNDSPNLVAPSSVEALIRQRFRHKKAPIVQRIEQWFPKPLIQVRVLVGAPVQQKIISAGGTC